MEQEQENERGWLKRRLRAVRRRKRARRDFECQVVAAKLRLVKIERQRGKS